ncbi:MAG TPA: 50S ribosomal protein L30, partial [Candidatus Limnocylindrales bacterium]
MAAKLKVTQVKSTISHIARNRATVRALGLHGIGSTSVVTDNPATRGMVRQVRFLVSVEEIADEGKRRTGIAEGRRQQHHLDADAPAQMRPDNSPKRINIKYRLAQDAEAHEPLVEQSVF